METLEKKPFGLRLGPTMFSLMNLLVILVGSYLIWEIFADPSQAMWKLYPQPFGVVLFWSILFVVFFAFLGQLWGLALPQPVSGLVWIALTTVLAVIAPAVVLHGYGSIDPAFDISKGGYTATAMIVLIGFYTWGILGTGMGHWPWVDLGLKQPWVGIAGFLLGFVLTFFGYIILIYPSLASWTAPDRTILPLTTVIGWFYCVILAHDLPRPGQLAVDHVRLAPRQPSRRSWGISSSAQEFISSSLPSSKGFWCRRRLKPVSGPRSTSGRRTSGSACPFG